MLPIILDPECLNVLVVGDGPATKNRLKMLENAKVENFDYYKDWSNEINLEKYNLAYIADFSDEKSDKIHHKLKQHNIFVNVEDKKKFCDFHVPSMIRRGSLLLTISTEGKSPRISRRFRKIFEYMFDESWKENLDLIGEKREEWKSLGDSYKELSEKTDQLIEEKNMLKKICLTCKKASE
jgi:precorrin-2 dehydrogenase/sirohydrochlorin ferrochelatase